MFADDLVYTHSNGQQNNKTEYMQSIRDGKSQYDKIEVEALNVRAYNDGKTAVVNGTITITCRTSPTAAQRGPPQVRGGAGEGQEKGLAGSAVAVAEAEPR